ncbi:hypothetical protein BTVI_15480 [Pitangus sulphuratus]|nr:hypothetical protein BTVI_15480 [Pitangus sulphuratus]
MWELRIGESGRRGPTSFYGRFRHFLDIIDPRTLFVTELQNGIMELFRLEKASKTMESSCLPSTPRFLEELGVLKE